MAPLPRARSPKPDAARFDDVRRALDEVLLEALRQPPVVVSFSGGRDSSLLLAAAADLAQRHGLQPPSARTRRYRGVVDADEASWQQRVVEHLGELVGDWTIDDIEPGEEDLLAPEAADVLRGHGPVWPPLAVHTPRRVRAAAGGWFLDGEGGDELFGGYRLSAAAAILAGYRPRRPLVGGVLRGLRPAAVGAACPDVRWLTPAGNRLRRRHERRRARGPLLHHRHLAATSGRRAVVAGEATIAALAAAVDVRVASPFLDRRVLAALAPAAGWFGFPTRTNALIRLFGDLLPHDVLHRTSKATFNGAAFGGESRRFAEAWDGSGVDRRLVDVDGLREEWLAAVPSGLTALLLHQAWLASEGRPR